MNENTALLDISPLKKAIHSLKRGLHRLQEVPDDEFVRDSCIQRFEYTYELCGKFLRRYLQLTESSADDVAQMTFPTLIRTACDRSLLLSDWSIWINYRDKRNTTSHTYDEEKAAAVIHVLPDFLKEASYLCDQLEKRVAT